jgi:hypothetical protein
MLDIQNLQRYMFREIHSTVQHSTVQHVKFTEKHSKVLANVFRDSIYKAFGKCDLSSISLYFSHKKNIISKKSFLSFTNKKHVHGKSAIFNIFVLFCLHLLNLGKFQLCIIVQVEHFELKIPYCLFQKVSKARSNVFLS